MPELLPRERRLALRLPIEVRGGSDSEGRFHEATRTLNLSGGGVCFESRRRLQVGMPLSLDIEIPPSLQHYFHDATVYQTRAIVYRVQRIPRSDVEHVVARFVSDPAHGS